MQGSCRSPKRDSIWKWGNNQTLPRSSPVPGPPSWRAAGHPTCKHHVLHVTSGPGELCWEIGDPWHGGHSWEEEICSGRECASASLPPEGAQQHSTAQSSCFCSSCLLISWKAETGSQSGQREGTDKHRQAQSALRQHKPMTLGTVYSPFLSHISTRGLVYSPGTSRGRFLSAVAMGPSFLRSSGLLRLSATFCFSRDRSFRLGSEAVQGTCGQGTVSAPGPLPSLMFFCPLWAAGSSP